jgi:hypothetical protein
MNGRPTKYNEGVQRKADEYAENYPSHGDAVPSYAGLAAVLDVDRSTIYEWADKHASFSHTLERIKNIQERALLNGGLLGEMNSNIVKLMLHNHGYSDKSQIEHSGDMKTTFVVDKELDE